MIGLRPKRAPAKPARQEDLVDLGRTFGVTLGSGDDTDSSDAEFAPENEKMDSEGMSGLFPFNDLLPFSWRWGWGQK